MLTLFHGVWLGVLIALMLLAVYIGKRTEHGWSGILIDNRGRYSLTHFQLVLWTLVILSSLVAVFFSQGLDPAALRLSPELLGLMGISLGSGVLATGVKAKKDSIGSGARVARLGELTLSDNETVVEIKASFAQIWLEEEGDLADKVVSIAKYQNFVFTLVIAVFYVAAVWKQAAIPTLPENIVWLIGISHAGYVGGKIPNKV